MPEKEKETEVTTICPCCGSSDFKDVQKLKTQDIELYTACMLTGQAFKKDYVILKGNVVITMSQLSENKLVLMQRLMTKINMTQDIELKNILSIASDVIYNKAMLTQINIYKEEQQVKSYKVQNIWYQVINKILIATSQQQVTEALNALTDSNNVGNININILKKINNVHSRLLQVMSTFSFDKDFFEQNLLD